MLLNRNYATDTAVPIIPATQAHVVSRGICPCVGLGRGRVSSVQKGNSIWLSWLKCRSTGKPEDWVWAVEAAARRSPWSTACIQKGLAVQRLLRHEGVDAALHYGARIADDEAKLEAHVWVSVDGAIMIGEEDASRFVEIAIFP